MVYWAVELFRIEAVQVNYHYEHVIVDETHDTSYDQAEFARLLAQKGTLFVVGDPSQSIYGFRGASNDLMFSDMDRPVYLLGRNYRSGERIISAFRPHAERNGVSVKLAEAMRAAGTEPGQVTLRPFWSEDAQAIEVASLIHGSVMAGNKPSSHAILSRTRALLAPYADMLRERGIPYKWLGKNFWKAKEIQDALAFFRLALNPNDLIAFHRIICSNVGCTKFLGDAFASTVMQAALDRNVPPLEIKYPPDCNNSRLDRWTNAREILTSLMQDANSMTPAVFLTAVMKRAGFGPGENNTDPDDFRQENVGQLVQRASRFQDIRAFVSHADRMARQQSKADSVVLSTIHGAKGLEWDTVFVIGISDGILPHYKATDTDEERRILYVALSRAKKELNVCWHGRESSLLQPLLKEFGDPRNEEQKNLPLMIPLPKVRPIPFKMNDETAETGLPKRGIRDLIPAEIPLAFFEHVRSNPYRLRIHYIAKVEEDVQVLFERYNLLLPSDIEPLTPGKRGGKTKQRGLSGEFKFPWPVDESILPLTDGHPLCTKKNDRGSCDKIEFILGLIKLGLQITTYKGKRRVA